MEKKFFKGKKVLITGHTGFKGAWLSLLLNKFGAQVFGYALNPPTSPNLYDLVYSERFIQSYIGDIRDFERLKDFIKETQPQIIIHLAAQSLVKASYKDPRFTFETNVMGTVNILEAARTTGTVKVILNVTTDKCYENKEWVWGYREDDVLGGHDPYSNSKACSELITASYRNAFFKTDGNDKNGIAVATARSGNIIGGGDWSLDRLVPDFMRSMQALENVVIRNPGATRPWQFILDSLFGYLILVKKLYTEGQDYAGSWNFGPGEDHNKTVGWVVSQLCINWGGNASYTIEDTSNEHEAKFLKLDSSKAKRRLAWSNVYSLEEGVDKTVEWYKEYLNGKMVRELCEFQIDEFMKIKDSRDK
ncbi:CDP-glucose 4,6-dehydratase [Gillisia sp. Hel_I_86]|uniref:CDP-glucose 4,6-dehydratase n=1 Tax=Gillisia sp. Hel_I_86 TaxID=1249981 RepID=UPI00119C7256|nr:CDP-glucose 4,6-dehydratase [Gillisia sp. Hel_I_86]TVZ27520.1 CDP-glucose 4,6-dehydratase [Gillisia sp. Hel_I_86]